MVRTIFALAALFALASCTANRNPESEPAGLADMGIADHQNLEANLRWMLSRGNSPGARVGVFADAGCWNVSARSIVEALERSGVSCRALDRTMLSAESLAGLEALVLPGGWAPFENAAAGDAGRAAIRAFAEKGGRVLGICAGGYLLSKTVAWEGIDYPYPLGLFDGTAKGPVERLARWPDRGVVRLRATEAGTARGLEALSGCDLLYYGGAEFVGGTGVTVLATYPGGGAALVACPFGKGEILLTGPHLERPAPANGGDDAAPPAESGPLLKALLGLK
jgi:glutamine amidotransferase-like uncharacterized protein